MSVCLAYLLKKYKKEYDPYMYTICSVYHPLLLKILHFALFCINKIKNIKLHCAYQFLDVLLETYWICFWPTRNGLLHLKSTSCGRFWIRVGEINFQIPTSFCVGCRLGLSQRGVSTKWAYVLKIHTSTVLDISVNLPQMACGIQM